MSAEGVISKNLKRTLSDPENAELLTVMEDLKTLKGSVGIVNGAVTALLKEEQNISSLGNLGALLHQADDLLDEIITLHRGGRLPRDQDGNLRENLGRALQRVVSASNRITEKVGLQFPSSSISPSPMAMQIDKLSRELSELGRQLKTKYNSIDVPESSIDPPQSYALSKNEVTGRDIDKNKIIKRLLKHRTNKTCFSVLPIIGSPGLGKTALAQLVYEDEKVVNHFDLRMWIQVTNITDENIIIKEIVESCTNRRSNYRQNPKPAKIQHSQVQQNGFKFRGVMGCRSVDISGANTNNRGSNKETIYERRLRKEIEGKVYLLVLDDASIIQAPRLKELLAAGARGSRILWTGHPSDTTIFKKTELLKSCKLEGLSQEDSRSLFEKFAFGQGERDAILVNIGHKIADNCGGVPLTVKVAASFLYGKNEEQWLYFNESLKRKEDRIEQVLKVSYNDLPTRLKACLNYCTLFPEEFCFNKHDLISHWIAQGFIHPPEQGNSLEDAAEKYFLELSRRCFFEDVITDRLGKIVTCKMHHLMHRKASTFSPEQINNRLRVSKTGVNLESTYKHVSLTCDQGSFISQSVIKAQNLRTLLLVKEPGCDTKIDSLVCTLISSFKCIRVLDLHDLGIEELPVYIGKLIHLRYLDLSRNDALATLPKSITELYNLQTLKLNSCTKLKRLPENFGELTNLTCFEVDECDSLPYMPLGMEKLIKLETMSRYVVGQDFSRDMASRGLKALEKLNNLRGRLEIELKTGWAATIEEASQAKLHEKTHLDELKISWAKTVLNCKDNTSKSSNNSNSNSESIKEKSSHEQLLEKLQPNPKLQILYIEGYKGKDFPRWAGVGMLAFSLPNLVDVSIEGCDECEHLPPFGKLKHLKRLTLRHMANVRFVQGEAFRISSSSGGSQEPTASPFFQNLEELNLHNFYKLEGWWVEQMLNSQDNTPSFPHLSKLRIWNCPKLRSMPLCSEVEEIDLRNVNQMFLEQSSKNFPNVIDSKVKCLQIKDCSTLNSFTTVKNGLGGCLPYLEKLVIEKCHSLSSLASELLNLKSLVTLEISNCKELDLSDYVSDDSNTENSLKCLRHLTLRDIPKIKYLPEGLKGACTLKTLCISACTSLTELPSWINCLKELQYLQIKSCEAVTNLPDQLEQVHSLKKVEITECPVLMERCREPTGKDCHKIRHARVLLHKSWRYGHMPEQGASNSRSNVRALTDVKYIIIPVIAAST